MTDLVAERSPKRERRLDPGIISTPGDRRDVVSIVALPLEAQIRRKSDANFRCIRLLTQIVVLAKNSHCTVPMG